ncbi:MAG: insulinase family protein [Planctomycetaceae bacterium]|nr:insulinase family protein [Planctomycetaceae bacterium]
MPQAISHFTFDNGLTLLVEPMPHVQSAAFAILTPAGTIYEPPNRNGTAAALTDLIMRGAGERDSQELIGTLDALGVQAHEHTGWNFISFSGATIASNLVPALELYGDVLQRPRLPEHQFLAVMSGVEQNLLAIEDEPQRQVFIELRKRLYESPWNRPSDGTLQEVEVISYGDIREQFERSVRPNGTLIGIAGNVDPLEVRDAVERIFGSWPRGAEPVVQPSPSPWKDEFLVHPSTQTHIGLAYPAVPYGDAQYFAASAATSVLSGGSSSRLFTEVREKRGLCYSVDANLSSLKDKGHVLAYAGTTTDRAQETLDVMLQVIRDLGENITDEELSRCKARDKSALVMQQESTPARASSIARDWFYLGRVQTLEEIRGKIDGLQVRDLLDYLDGHPPEPITGFCVGERALDFRHSPQAN